MNTNLIEPSTVVCFYNCRSEEPKSWEWGRKVTWALEDAGIEYELWRPYEDEPYETQIKVSLKDYQKATRVINQIKTK